MIKVNQTRVCLRVGLFALLPIVAIAQDPSGKAGSEDGLRVNSEIEGRIVAYDWVLHETTSGDDFVVKAKKASQGAPRYIRVVYKPYWGFDSPPSEPTSRLDRWAFVGRGQVWKLQFRAPITVEEHAACGAAVTNHKYHDEEGDGEIPRFVSTPGADGERFPPVSALQCFVLPIGGLERVRVSAMSHKDP